MRTHDYITVEKSGKKEKYEKKKKKITPDVS